jgi:hypothetical protein
MNVDVNSISKNNTLIDKLIEAKKLQFNHIWACKITQEDLNIPQTYDDGKINICLMKNLSNSIIKFAINLFQIFENSLYTAKDDYKELLYLSNALVQKIENLSRIKSKDFKISKDSLEPLIRLQSLYKLFINNISSNDLSKRLEEIYVTINDFNINMSDECKICN